MLCCIPSWPAVSSLLASLLASLGHEIMSHGLSPVRSMMNLYPEAEFQKGCRVHQKGVKLWHRFLYGCTTASLRQG